MVTFIKLRRNDNKEVCRTVVSDNWFTVYQDRARFEGRRLNWLSERAFEVIFTEKNYSVLLIKE